MNGVNWEPSRCMRGLSAAIGERLGPDHALENSVDVGVHPPAGFRCADLAEALRFEDVDESVAHARVLEVAALAGVMRQTRDLLVAVPAQRSRESARLQCGERRF